MIVQETLLVNGRLWRKKSEDDTVVRPTGLNPVTF